MHKLKGEIQIEFKEKLLHNRYRQEVEEVAQRGCAVSIPGTGKRKDPE